MRLTSGRTWGMLCTLTLMWAVSLWCASSTRAASYWTSGRNFIRDGATFVPKGVNLNGSNWVWNDNTNQHADAAQNGWKFNIVRLNCQIKSGYTDNNDLDGIISTYTNRGIAVMLEPHDWTGNYPNDAELTTLRNWWIDKANRYKNNSAVWFNVMNEPGYETGNNTTSRWLDVHDNVISAIRNAGANNIIICDGSSWGQDQANWGTTFSRSGSAILTYGPTLKNRYANIGFSVHVYDQFGAGTQNDANNKLAGYLDAVNNAGLPLLIGETGSYLDANTADPSSTSAYNYRATLATYNSAPSRGNGILAWHGQPGDGYALVTGSNGSLSGISSYTNPNNLSWHGALLWNYTRNGSSSSTPSPTPTPTPAPASGPNLLTNPGFEADGASVGTPSGWGQWSAWSTTSAGYSEGGGRSGNFRAAQYAPYGYSIVTYQNKGGLASGNYTLRAWVRSSGGQTTCRMYAKNYGGSEVSSNIGATGSWTQISITNINVSSGNCEIGFFSESAASKWLQFDDVEFFKQ